MKLDARSAPECIKAHTRPLDKKIVMGLSRIPTLAAIAAI
jgi:hypothetical protein